MDSLQRAAAIGLMSILTASGPARAQEPQAVALPEFPPLPGAAEMVPGNNAER
ncbi:MAG: hypothetical protein GY953_46215, partial [bacterium]|nr:hypothetical protein [bacterium]